MKSIFFGVAIIASISLMGCSTSSTAEEKLAKCLTKQGAVFYGTEWCPHCKDQKTMFGTAIQFVNFVDCDAESTTCSNAKIDGYPTWVLKDNKRLDGTQELSDLAKASNCNYSK